MFKNRVKFLRTSAGISQQRLAFFLGVERSTIGKWETQNVIPSGEMLKAIAEFFNVSTDYLLGKKDDDVDNVEYPDEYQGLDHTGEYLQETREENGYTIAELSEETGISEKVLLEYEDGTRPVKSNLFEKILKVYDMTRPDFEIDNNIPTYEARKEFHGDYNRSLAFDKAIEQDHYAEMERSFDLTSHEKDVVVAYRKQPEMQPAVDKILGVASDAPKQIQILAAHSDKATFTKAELTEIENYKEALRKAKKGL